MNRREFLTLGAATVAAGCMTKRGETAPAAFGATEDEVAAFWKAVDFLERTKPADYEARQDALKAAQKMIYAMCPASDRRDMPDNVYKRFVKGGAKMPADEVAAIRAEHPALAWYDREFDRVLAEVKSTTVAPGDDPAVWYVYNMGVIVKTAKLTFSIDLCHRKAAEAVPLLDFALVTHNHGDHFTDEFLLAMTRGKKKVISNFFLCWNGYCRELEKTLKFGDVTVRCTATDHGGTLPFAVTCFEIEVDCGADKAPYVIFHTGDSSSPRQLKCVAQAPDLMISHCAIGFSYPEAWKRVKPRRFVIAHHQELGHLWSRWRCVGFHEEPADIMAHMPKDANMLMPVWGDRLV